MLIWKIEEIVSMEPDLTHSLQELWLQDPFSSPFGTPSLLEVMVRKSLSEKARVFFIEGFSQERVLAAMWPLIVDRSGILHFLQGAHCDQRTCLYRPEIEITELANGFVHGLSQINPSGVFMAGIPPWGQTLKAVQVALHKLKWPYKAFPAVSCPILEIERKPGFEKHLRQHFNQRKSLRNLTNRLRRKPGYAFEVLKGQEGLEEWAADFCDLHEWLWDRTSTPSKYRSRKTREFFLDILKAWSKDRALVRFSIRVDRERIALVVGLLSRNRLIYHHTARSPEFESLSLGNVALRLIGLWMADQGISVLDFGLGGEKYKLRYSNKDEKLWRVYAAPRKVSRVYLQGRVEERIRKSTRLQKLWDKSVNEVLRGNLKHFINNCRLRIQIILKVHLSSPTPIRSVTGALKSKLGIKREIFYYANGSPESKNPRVVELETFDVLEMLEGTTGLSVFSRASLIEYRHNGARPFGIIGNGKVQHVSWLKKAPIKDVPAWIRGNGKSYWWIQRSVTARTARGKGFYPQVLRGILGVIPPEDVVMIYTDTWNKASQRGIQKAGFKPFALRDIRRGISIGEFERLSSDMTGISELSRNRRS